MPVKSGVNDSLDELIAPIAPLDFQLYSRLAQCIYPTSNH